MLQGLLLRKGDVLVECVSVDLELLTPTTLPNHAPLLTSALLPIFSPLLPTLPTPLKLPWNPRSPWTVQKPLVLFNSFISDKESDAHSRERFAQCSTAGQQQSSECWERAPSVCPHMPECPVFLSQPPSSDFPHSTLPVVLSVYFLHLSPPPHSLHHFLNFKFLPLTWTIIIASPLILPSVFVPFLIPSAAPSSAHFEDGTPSP